VWDIAQGLQIPGNGDSPDASAGAADPLAAINVVNSLATPDGTAILCLVNFHRFMQSPEIIQALARQISRELKDEDGTISAIVLDSQWEERIAGAIVSTNQGSFAALEPAEVRRLVDHVKEGIEKGSQKGQLPVLLTTPELRRHVRKMLQRFMPSVSVLSYNEISPDIRLVAVNR